MTTARNRGLISVNTWLDCYVGHDAEPRLRQLIIDATSAPS